MNDRGRYDGILHMFVEEARSPDPRRLRFMRWLVEHNHFGRPAAGPVGGEFASTPVEEVRPAVDPGP